MDILVKGMTRMLSRENEEGQEVKLSAQMWKTRPILRGCAAFTHSRADIVGHIRVLKRTRRLGAPGIRVCRSTPGNDNSGVRTCRDPASRYRVICLMA